MKDNEKRASTIKEVILWWEKKRVLFNLLVIAMMTWCIYDMLNLPMVKITGTNQIILESLIYLLVANLFYSLGWGIEVLGHSFLNTRRLNAAEKWSLFAFGTLMTLTWTFFYYGFLFDAMFAH